MTRSIYLCSMSLQTLPVLLCTLEVWKRSGNLTVGKMKHSTDGKKKVSEETVQSWNKELEIILSGDSETVKCLRNHFRRLFLWKCVKWLALMATICSAFYYIPVLNWNVAALGRLGLIKFVLPFYNWESWSSARCLIDSIRSPIVAVHNEDYDYNNLARDECAICENILHINRITNTTYKDLYDNYLLRQIPVIISDSHDAWTDLRPDQNFIKFLQSQPPLMRSVPCNVATNLLMERSSKPTTLQKLMKQTELLANNEEWFLHFRNCQFDAVKYSRAILPHTRRPYYLSSHLAPFYSSWLLVSNHYRMTLLKQLNVKDLVVVLQMQGVIDITLAIKEPCTDVCINHEFHLHEGEALIFVATTWDFFYSPVENSVAERNELTVTFIQEIDWQ